MAATTSGRYRVLDSPRDRSELLLVDLDGEAFEPTFVRATGYEGALAETVAALRPGYVVEATLAWDGDGEADFADLAVERRSLVEFVDGITGTFEAARETWHAAEAAGEAMNSRVTRNTDGDANGVLYVFARQSGARDLFEEFRSGSLPIEPLLRRVNEERDDGDEREVFVMRPADEPFVIVYIALRKEGLLADTVRETYDCPRSE